MTLKVTHESPTKKAQYYPHLKRLTYWVTDQAKQTIHDISESQARAYIKEAATGHREIVQVLEIVPNNKI